MEPVRPRAEIGMPTVALEPVRRRVGGRAVGGPRAGRLHFFGIWHICPRFAISDCFLYGLHISETQDSCVNTVRKNLARNLATFGRARWLVGRQLCSNAGPRAFFCPARS